MLNGVLDLKHHLKVPRCGLWLAAACDRQAATAYLKLSHKHPIIAHHYERYCCVKNLKPPVMISHLIRKY